MKLVTCDSNKLTDDYPIVLKTESGVHHKIKYIITPKTSPDYSQLSLHISLESFENADVIKQPIQDILIMTDKTDLVYDSGEWIVISENDYLIEGSLVYKLSNSIQFPLVLRLFLLEEVELIWSDSN